MYFLEIKCFLILIVLSFVLKGPNASKSAFVQVKTDVNPLTDWTIIDPDVWRYKAWLGHIGLQNEK